MRPSRLAALAWRDLRLVVAGRRGYRLPLLALGLLLPAGALPTPELELPRAPAVAAGDIPPALADRVAHRPRSGLRLRAGDPLVVIAPGIPDATREALNTLPGEPVVVVEQRPTPVPTPSRGLLIALLGLSLLTGPLAESLPGERSRRTLDTLRSAAISEAELVAGKWLAWTGAASAFTLAAAAPGMATGALGPGLWLAGLPLVAATAVALGLWLGRDAADEIDGASRTLRVLPAVALGLATLAFLISLRSPTLAAAVPLGGALLLSADMLPGVAPALAALAGTAACCLALGRATTRALQDEAGAGPGPWREWAALTGSALVLWWLPAMGPASWSVAGNPDLAASLSVESGLAAGGLLLAGLAALAALRAHLRPRRPSPGGLPRALAVGLALAMAAGISAWEPQAPGVAVEAARLRSLAAQAPGWAGAGVALCVALGHEALFRGWMQRRFGAVAAGLAWLVVASPLAPGRGLVAALSLGFLSARGGWVAAFVAHLTWSLAGTRLSLASPGATFAAAAIAVALAALPTRAQDPPESLVSTSDSH